MKSFSKRRKTVATKKATKPKKHTEDNYVYPCEITSSDSEKQSEEPILVERDESLKNLRNR